MNTQIAPDAAQSFNTGNAAFRAEKWHEAIKHFDEALRLDEKMEPAALQRARCLVKLGELMPAREAFAHTLRINPANYSAWLEAGHLCRQMGETQQALACYQRAIDAAPDRYEAPLAMTRTLELMGEFAVAERSLQHALESAAKKSPQTVREVHQNMGKYRLERGDLQRALASLRSALALAVSEAGDEAAEDAAEIRIDIGELLLRAGNREKAVEILAQANNATREKTLVRLSELLFRYNLWEDALHVLRRNLELHPQSALAHWNLAHLLAECWQMEEAEALLAKAEAIAPMPGAASMRASIAGRRGDADAALAIYRGLATDGKRNYTLASSAAMSSLYSDKLSAQQVADMHRELFAPLGEGARSVQSFRRAPLAGRRVKLGIVSADFHFQHPVNIFMQPVLRELDRSRFETFMYFTGISTDEQTQLARTRIEHWVESTTLNDAQLAKRIDADGIDILLDLSGHTGQNRAQLFAKRAAPVQVTYLGYPGSTGLPNMDWLLGDAVVTPAGCETLYSENVYRLPGTVFCFAPEVDYPQPLWSSAMAERPLTFGSFNNVPKLTPHTLGLWARILARLPQSRLVLKAPSFKDPGAVRAFSERLEKLGVDLQRVEFRGPVGLTDMMAEYADIDIGLDPVPYNGGTTTLQAMWMGVPVVVKEGNNFVSRMGASFMRAAGLPEWVAADDDAYVDTAVRMATARAALLELKRGMRERLLKNPAWDVKQHTRAFEQALLLMAVR